MRRINELFAIVGIATVNLDAALEYAQRHKPAALLVSVGGHVIAQHGASEASPHALYSGTKSFWGIAALHAQRDGIFDLDEPAARTITEWNGDAAKSQITVRMLLQMTAGYGFGGLGSAVPPYDRAIALPLKNHPGERFTYSGIPLQVFGAVFARKLQPQGLTPHDYLRRTVLDPAGVSIASWRTLKDGAHPLPTGATLSARNWLAYGEYVRANHDAYAAALRGSTPNPRYGLCWWLGSPAAPDDLFYASGSGGQALYIVPSQELVVVHFGESSSYKHDAFLKRLFL